MRITVLHYKETEKARKSDEVVEEVAEALRERDHEVSVLGVHGDVKKMIDGLDEQKPELIFNLLEEFGSNVGGNIPAIGLLELLGHRFTGSGAGESYLGQDKALAKRLLKFEDILYPNFAVFSQAKDLETGGNLHFPLFVKPVALDASLGIDKKSLVTDMTQLMNRVQAIHKECKDAALAEEYIEGREFYVGILGNSDPLALPPIEADFSGLPEGAPKIYDRKAKFEPKSKEFQGTNTAIATIPDELRAKMQKISIAAYRALRVRDYGRVDLRLAETGEIYVLEVNASCYLQKDDEFAVAAKAAGFEYPDLIQKIVELAMARHGK